MSTTSSNSETVRVRIVGDKVVGNDCKVYGYVKNGMIFRNDHTPWRRLPTKKKPIKKGDTVVNLDDTQKGIGREPARNTSTPKPLPVSEPEPEEPEEPVERWPSPKTWFIVGGGVFAAFLVSVLVAIAISVAIPNSSPNQNGGSSNRVKVRDSVGGVLTLQNGTTIGGDINLEFEGYINEPIAVIKESRSGGPIETLVQQTPVTKEYYPMRVSFLSQGDHLVTVRTKKEIFYKKTFTLTNGKLSEKRE